MSAYRFVTLTCDTCGEVWDAANATRIPEARRVAKSQAWTSDRGQDWCPACSGTHVRSPMGLTRIPEASA